MKPRCLPFLSFLTTSLVAPTIMPPLPPPPQYTLLPDKPLSDNKPGLERTVSDSPRSTTSPSHPSRTRKLLLVATGALAITVLASALYATNLVMLNGCHTSESRRARAGTSAELPPQFERQRLEKRADAAAPEKEHPKFSTHTYTDEEGTSTSTFVYETTPIVSTALSPFSVRCGLFTDRSHPNACSC